MSHFHPDHCADYVLDNSPFNVSDTFLYGSTFLKGEASLQRVSKTKDNFRMDDDKRLQFAVAHGQRQLRLGGSTLIQMQNFTRAQLAEFSPLT